MLLIAEKMASSPNRLRYASSLSDDNTLFPHVFVMEK